MIGLIDTMKTETGRTKSNFEIEKKYEITPLQFSTIFSSLCERKSLLRRKSVKERDIYYTSKHKDFICNKECLRIREKDDISAELTYKPASTSEMSGFFAKKEFNFEISDVENFKKVLTHLDFLPVADVIKNRIFFSFDDGINICIDDLKDVGYFVEVEIVSEGGGERRLLLEKIEDVAEEIGLSESQVSKIPYRDYIINKSSSQSLLIFDFDGVIANTEPIFLAALQEIFFKEFGIKVDKEYYVSTEMFGKGDVIAEIFDKHNLSESNKDKVSSKIYDLYLKKLIKTQESLVDSEMINVLNFLAKKLFLGIVSSSKRIFIDKILERYKIDNLFSYIVSREDTKLNKPTEEPLVALFKKISNKPKNILVIEDSGKGLKGAQAMNLDCVLVETDFNTKSVSDFKNTNKQIQVVPIAGIGDFLKKWSIGKIAVY